MMGVELAVRFRTQVVDWLAAGIRYEPRGDKVFTELCSRIGACGIPLSRATLHLRIHHPQWLGTRMTWLRGQKELGVETVAYDVAMTDAFLHSPFRVAIDSGKRVRQKLQINGPHIFALYEELKQTGQTDYVAYPLDHTQGRRHLLTFATDRSSGFSDQELALLDTILPWYSLVTEVRVKDQLVRTLLETYVGAQASEEILHGAITRGSRKKIAAAILICDLRNFTRLSDRRPREELIGILNSYFDIVAEPIEHYGGEILKFIGDGLLAVFPLDRPDACKRLLSSVRTCRADALRLQAAGQDIEFGIGVHLGEVWYGNIGSRKRLDFTVIGSAVNLAYKLEALTKVLDHPVLLSEDFVNAAACLDQTDYLGQQRISGLDVSIGVYAMRDNSHMSC